MLKVNEYFDGAVKSISLQNEEGVLTLGVMEKGEYEFGTSSVEYVTVVSGTMTVLLPGETEWKTYHVNETFIVPKDSRFQLQIPAPAAYKCLYK